MHKWKKKCEESGKSHYKFRPINIHADFSNFVFQKEVKESILGLEYDTIEGVWAFVCVEFCKWKVLYDDV